MSEDDQMLSRRSALGCLAFGAAGTLFTLAGGVLTPQVVAAADARTMMRKSSGKPLFVQLSDTHIGFHKDANPDVVATLDRAIDRINALEHRPAFALHTGDITHLSKPAEFDTAAQLLSRLAVSELHTVPGEHDVADAEVKEYFARFGAASEQRGYYSFDHSGVHFLALVNVLQAKDGGAGYLGDEQLAWLAADLRARTASTPIVVFAHMPLWNVYEPWGWRTSDSGPLLTELRRFGSVTVLNGHIHQIVQKVEGNMTFHTAPSTAFPQPAPGMAAGPGPLKVPTEELARHLGLTTVSVHRHPLALSAQDFTLAQDDGNA